MLSLPKPPYYAVIFSSNRNETDDGYYALNSHLMGMAESHPGYLGIESYREASGRGVSVVYFRDMESIRAWRTHPEHSAAKAQREKWYHAYSVKIAKVEEEYGWDSQG
jgi:heme-degrading monooxygenase HmoA